MSDPRYFQEGFDKCLAHFVEECGEVVTAAGKTLRWGPTSSNPELPVEQREANVTWLVREIFDTLEAGQRLLDAILKMPTTHGVPPELIESAVVKMPPTDGDRLVVHLMEHGHIFGAPLDGLSKQERERLLEDLVIKLGYLKRADDGEPVAEPAYTLAVLRVGIERAIGDIQDTEQS